MNIPVHAPRSTAIALALLTCVALAGALRVTTDPSGERLFLRHHDTYRTYQRFLTTFGSDETVLTVLHHPEASLLQPRGRAGCHPRPHSRAHRHPACVVSHQSHHRPGSQPPQYDLIRLSRAAPD